MVQTVRREADSARSLPGGSPQGPQRRYVSIPGHRADEPRELRAEREKGVASGARGDLRFELVQNRARGLQVGECLSAPSARLRADPCSPRVTLPPAWSSPGCTG